MFEFLSGRFQKPANSPRRTALQTARVVGFASLLALLGASRVRAQSAARIDVRATVVDVTPSRAALAATKWLAARKGSARKESGLVTVEVNRDRRKVSINYLRN